MMFHAARRFTMAYWLLKTEPNEYSYADLEREKVGTWDGVKNPTAQNNLRSMALGDTCVIYHSGDGKAAVGLATVVKTGYPDPTDGAGKRVLVDLSPTGLLGRPVTLAEMKGMAIFDGSPLVRIPRLSVVPLASAQFEALMAASKG
jgi:predicted RNA-binding protein with PUA-like domain